MRKVHYAQVELGTLLQPAPKERWEDRNCVSDLQGACLEIQIFVEGIFESNLESLLCEV